MLVKQVLIRMFSSEENSEQEHYHGPECMYQLEKVSKSRVWCQHVVLSNMTKTDMRPISSNDQSTPSQECSLLKELVDD